MLELFGFSFLNVCLILNFMQVDFTFFNNLKFILLIIVVILYNVFYNKKLTELETKINQVQEKKV